MGAGVRRHPRAALVHTIYLYVVRIILHTRIIKQIVYAEDLSYVGGNREKPQTVPIHFHDRSDHHYHDFD